VEEIAVTLHFAYDHGKTSAKPGLFRFQRK
jgi:hypothetical protein